MSIEQNPSRIGGMIEEGLRSGEDVLINGDIENLLGDITLKDLKKKEALSLGLPEDATIDEIRAKQENLDKHDLLLLRKGLGIEKSSIVPDLSSLVAGEIELKPQEGSGSSVETGEDDLEEAEIVESIKQDATIKKQRTNAETRIVQTPQVQEPAPVSAEDLALQMDRKRAEFQALMMKAALEISGLKSLPNLGTPEYDAYIDALTEVQKAALVASYGGSEGVRQEQQRYSGKVMAEKERAARELEAERIASNEVLANRAMKLEAIRRAALEMEEFQKSLLQGTEELNQAPHVTTEEELARSRAAIDEGQNTETPVKPKPTWLRRTINRFTQR